MHTFTVRIMQLGARRALDLTPPTGRDADLKRLLDSLRRWPALMVVGDPGIGKSSLGCLIVGHYSSGAESEFGQVVWLGLMGDETFTEIGAHIIQTVGGVSKLPPSYGAQPDQKQAEQALEALRERPALMVIDNVSVPLVPGTRRPADPGLAHFLDGARDQLGHSRLIMTAEVGLDGFTSEGPERFRLAGLSQMVGSEWLATCGLDDDSVEARAMLRQASEKAGGHPAGLRLLATLVQREGAEVGGRGLHGYMADPRLWSGSRTEIAQRFYDRVLRRVLDDEARKVILAASFFRRPVSAAAIAAAVEADAKGVEASCLKLAAEGMLSRTHEGWLLEPVWREMIHARLKPAVRDKVYRRLEQFWLKDFRLQQGKPFRCEDLQPALHAVEHACGRGDRARAAELMLAGGLLDELRRRGLSSKAVNLLKMAVEPTQREGVTDIPPDEAMGMRLLMAGLRLLTELERAGDGAELGRRALILAQRVGDEATQARVLWCLGAFALQLGEIERALSCLQRSRDAARDGGDLRTESAASFDLGRAHFSRSEWPEARLCFDDAAEGFGQVGDTRRRGLAMYYGATVLENLGELDKAEQLVGMAYGLLLEARSDLAQRAGEMLHTLQSRRG